MTTLLTLLILVLTVHVETTVEDMTLVIIDSSGTVVGERPALAPGNYVFDLADGAYTVRAVVADTIVASIPDVRVPATAAVVVAVDSRAVERARTARATATAEGARRNQNIQVNLVDNQALNEALGRQGARMAPVAEFSAARGNYAADLGGLGQAPAVLRGDRQPAFRGEVFATHNNNHLNSRTFFQVGEVLPSRRNQYGFRVSGPLGSDAVSFVLNAEEMRESGFVNGNVRVPLPSERVALAEDPALRALIQSWLDAYPAETPNRPEIDIRLLNTNALQKVRYTGGSFRLDWEPGQEKRLSLRYSIRDNFIDSFEFVVGQNPNQRLRPQTVGLAWEQPVSSTTVLQLGANLVRRKVDVLVPPGSVGPFVNPSREIQGLGPPFNIPINRVSNDYEYLAQATTTIGTHKLDWGGHLVRAQLNEFQADGARGVVFFGNNGGRTGVENFQLGEAVRYSVVLGTLYRGFRETDFALFVNDRFRVAPGLDLSLGLRYEFAGAPREVNDLTVFSFRADSNNFAPRIGVAWSSGATVFRAGYGIAYGTVFPATYRQGRLNPPEVFRVDVQSPDLLDPLKDFVQTPGEVARHQANLLAPELVVPYSHQYTLQVERELSPSTRLRAAYMGSRTWKLFRTVRENRAERVDDPALMTTRTINDRRPDKRFFSVARVENQGRAYFDAAQITIDHVWRQRLSLRATYTFSKALDTGSDFTNTAVARDERRAQIEAMAFEDLKALSRFDAPHSFVIGYSYTFPRMMGAFTLSGTTILRDGTPFEVRSGTDSPPFGNVDGERGDRPSILDPGILGASVDHPDTAQHVLRRETFDAEAPFREGRGNLARNTFRKDGTTNFNVALARAFPIFRDQTRTLSLRIEFINAFNHPQFDEPNSGLSDPTFGQITDTLNAGRIIQASVRFSF